MCAHTPKNNTTPSIEVRLCAQEICAQERLLLSVERSHATSPPPCAQHEPSQISDSHPQPSNRPLKDDDLPDSDNIDRERSGAQDKSKIDRTTPVHRIDITGPGQQNIELTSDPDNTTVQTEGYHTQRKQQVHRNKSDWLTKLKSNIPVHKDVLARTRGQYLTSKKKKKMSMELMKWLQKTEESKEDEADESGTTKFVLSPLKDGEMESTSEPGLRGADKTTDD